MFIVLVEEFFLLACFVTFEADFIMSNEILIYIRLVLYVVCNLYQLHVAMAYLITVRSGFSKHIYE